MLIQDHTVIQATRVHTYFWINICMYIKKMCINVLKCIWTNILLFAISKCFSRNSWGFWKLSNSTMNTNRINKDLLLKYSSFVVYVANSYHSFTRFYTESQIVYKNTIKNLVEINPRHLIGKVNSLQKKLCN